MPILVAYLLLRFGVMAHRRGDHTWCGFGHIHRTLHLRVLHLQLLGRSFRMCIEQLHLAVELGLDLRGFDFGLDLDLLMDDVVLCFLPFDLRLISCGGLIGLCPR